MNAAFHAYIQAASADLFEELALAFAADVINPDKPAMLRIQTGNHPDFLRIRPDGASIRISQVRDLISTLSVRPFEGGRRAVVIFLAEAMTAQAQNCLLKTLEDPPSGTAFLLLCERPLMLLSTICSRCMTLPAPKQVRDDTALLADDFLDKLRSTRNVLDVAETFPKDRTSFFSHCTKLLDGLDSLIHRAVVTLDASAMPLQRCVLYVNRTQSMLEHNVSAAMCAQWLCIQIKEEYYGNRCRCQV